MMKVHFIVNEQAGGNKGKKVWRKLAQQIEFDYKVFITTGRFAASQYVNSLDRLANMQLIVAIGGDGTINEVINGANGRDDLIVSFMKAGSGNDFARGIQCFESYEEIVAFMNRKNKKRIDVATIQSDCMHKNFVNNCGLGFDAYVSCLVNQSKVKKYLNGLHLGKLSYVYIMLRALFTYKPFNLEVTLNGAGERQQYHNVWFMTVSNQPYFGGGMKISPKSNVEDGQIEVTIVRDLPIWRFLLLFLTVYNGSHTKQKEVLYIPVESIDCKLDKPVHCHTDGEAMLIHDKEYYISVSRGQLIIPA